MKLSLKKTVILQKTITDKLTFKGYSLFSSPQISMQLLPAKINTGIIFNVNGTKIPALVDFLNPIELHTTSLMKGKTKVVMIEHLLSAIYGLGIDNLEIKLDQEVIPAQDGSAQPFVQAIKKVGIKEQNGYRTVIDVKQKGNFSQSEFKGRKATLSPNSNGLVIELTAPFPAPINTYTVKYSEGDDFEKNISWARTFLRSPLDLNNQTKWEDIRTVYRALPKNPTKSPIITFTENEFLTPLKAENEPAVHKMLDTIGDLTLVGYRINGYLKINVPGHKFTHKIAKEIRDTLRSEKLL